MEFTRYGFYDLINRPGPLWLVGADLSEVALQVAQLRIHQEETQKELRLRTLMPSILDKAFKGEL